MARSSASAPRRRWSLVLVVAMACVLVAPRMAWARSLVLTTTDIDATVSTDGSLAIVEQRSYKSRGGYNGLLWDLPQGIFEGREIRATVAQVAVVSDGQQVQLVEGSDGAPGTYELSDEGDYLEIKMYWPMQDETIDFQVCYELSNLVSRWEDVGELYWQYVQKDPGAEGETQDVTLTVHLPVPEGAVVDAGENVRAWMHGPLDGSVSFAGEHLFFYSPGVGTEEFLEARVTFPAEWLTDAPYSSEVRLDTILAEEDKWAKEANAERRRARLVVYGIPGFMVLAGIGSVVTAIVLKRRRHAKGPKTQFQDTYFRDVPTNDHPAVLGMLYRQGHLEAKDFSATLMRLVDQGRVGFDAVWVERQGKRGNYQRERTWQLLLHDQAPLKRVDTRAGGKAIDDSAFDFLYNVVASKGGAAMGASSVENEADRSVLMSSFDEAAERRPEAYAKGYGHWSDAVRSAYEKREFEEDVSDSLLVGVLGLGSIVASIIVAIVGLFMGVPNGALCVGLIVWFAAGVYVLLSDEDEPSVTYTQEAVDIIAQLEGLKRWLVEFTRLHEAIPTDVVLWNRLLVMATVLGVADKVVKQLRVSAPQLVADPAFTAYGWYASELDEDLEEPFVTVARSVEKGHSISAKKLYHETSTSDVASSSRSSSRGSGGGASRGGGGGFSGGGSGRGRGF